MYEVGVRELKQNLSTILKRVRTKKEAVEITYRGRTVARIVPVVDERQLSADDAAVFEEVEKLAKEIGARWPKGVSAVDAVREQRREL
jgi:prevent-host-death family protein